MPYLGFLFLSPCQYLPHWLIKTFLEFTCDFIFTASKFEHDSFNFCYKFGGIFIFISLAAIGFIVIQPIFWNLPTQVLKGKGAAAAIALIGSLGNLGGFVAPTLKTYIENHFGVEFGLIVLALIAIL